MRSNVERWLRQFMALPGLLNSSARVVSAEARRLGAMYGEPCLGDRQRTPILIPSLKRFHELDTRQIDSRVFRRGVFDVFWFFAAFTWMHVLTELHRSLHFAT